MLSPLTQAYADLLAAWPEASRPSAPPSNQIDHYINGVPNPAWLAIQLADETEGSRTPAQTDPHPVVMDESTPALLRKQAA